MQIFQRTLKDLGLDAKVYTTDMKPEMAPAGIVSDGCIKVSRCTADCYIDELLQICKDKNIGVIIPTIDTELLILSQNKQRFDENEFDMIFLDHMMPEMDGIETLHKMKERHIDTPVIALTANAVAGVKDMYLKEGFEGYLSKPIDGTTMEKMMMEHLPASKMQKPSKRAAAVPGAGLAPSEPEKDTLLPDWLKEVETIDTKEGLKNNADMEMYMSMLGIFYRSIDEKSSEIRGFYEEEDWKNYTIKVHALKSSARIIGAMKLNALAQELEDAGNANDAEKIKAKTEEFLSMYEEYKKSLSPIDPTLYASDDTEDDRPDVDPAMLSDAYSSLKEFADAEDYDLAEMVINSLKEFRLLPDDDKKIKDIEKNLYALKWDEIKNILNS